MTAPSPIVAWCRTCRQDTVPLNNGRCAWCDTPIPDGWRAGRLDLDTVRAAHARHEAGRSIRDLGRDLYHQLGYASPHACTDALSNAFRTLELPTRPRAVAAGLASRQRARAAA